MAGLTSEEVGAFAPAGYVICRRRLFDDRELDELEDIFATLRTTRRGRLGDEFDTPHFDEPRLFAFLLSDQVLDLVEGLLGPDLVLWSSHFIARTRMWAGRRPGTRIRPIGRVDSTGTTSSSPCGWRWIEAIRTTGACK